jgi:hypothetical protein
VAAFLPLQKRSDEAIQLDRYGAPRDDPSWVRATVSFEAA